MFLTNRHIVLIKRSKKRIFVVLINVQTTKYILIDVRKQKNFKIFV